MLPGHCDEATVWKAGRPHHEPGCGPGGRFHFPAGNNPISWIGRITVQPLERNQGFHIAGSRVGGGSRRHRRSTPRSSQESLGPSDASYLDPVKNPLCRVSKAQMVHESLKLTPRDPIRKDGRPERCLESLPILQRELHRITLLESLHHRFFPPARHEDAPEAVIVEKEDDLLLKPLPEGVVTVLAEARFDVERPPTVHHRSRPGPLARDVPPFRRDRPRPGRRGRQGSP